MVLAKHDISQTNWIRINSFEDIPKDHIAHFLVKFTDEFFTETIDEKLDEKLGRPIYPKKILLNILLFAAINRKNSTEEIADLVQHHHHYKFIAHNLKPSARTLRRFKEDYGYLFEFIIQSTLIKAKNEKRTEFDHIAIDGTIIKANNSNYNIITLEEIESITNLLKMGLKNIDEYLKENTNIKLRRSAYKFLKNKKQTLDEKLDILKKLKSSLLKSGQNSIGLIDSDARWMKNKKKQTELSFNVQASVDHKSRLIVAIDAIQDPTDHYQLKPQIKNINNNLGEYPTIISADYGYRSHDNLKYLKKHEIDGYIPNQKQSREVKNKKPSNPYHKDYFIYDEEIDAYICPENQILAFKKQYTYKKRPRRMYYTYKCKKCPVKDKCTKSNCRTISEFGDDLEKEMKEKMDSPRGQEEYGKRMKTVEPVFGFLKKQHSLNELEQRGMNQIKTELNLMAAAYNIKQLQAHKMNDEKQKAKNLKDFQEEFKKKFPNSNIEITFVNEESE